MAAREESRHWARWPQDQYGSDNTRIDQGQVFALQGARNDERLVRLGYVSPLEKGSETYQCAECGAEFVSETFRTVHGRKRHRVTELTPEQEDEQADREERQLVASAPLYLDRSAAARA